MKVRITISKEASKFSLDRLMSFSDEHSQAVSYVNGLNLFPSKSVTAYKCEEVNTVECGATTDGTSQEFIVIDEVREQDFLEKFEQLLNLIYSKKAAGKDELYAIASFVKAILEQKRDVNFGSKEEARAFIIKTLDESLTETMPRPRGLGY